MDKLKNKKNTKTENFVFAVKKLILNWTFWLILAIIFSFGTSKTFEYLSFFAFLFVIVLAGISIINYLHKKPIEDYWKVSLTIIGIILIAVIVFFYIKELNPLNNPNKLIKESLENDGYEVLDVRYFDDGVSSFSPLASVDMKSFGDLNEQAQKGLTTLSLYIKNASSYSVIIFTPTSKCYYNLDGTILNAYWNTFDEEVWNTDPNTRIESTEVIKVKNSLDYLLWENAVINAKIEDVFSPLYMDRLTYEKINETGITFSVLSSVVDYKIEIETESCS